MTAHISLKKVPAKQLFLDFRGLKIGNLKINGTQVNDDSCFRNHKIYLPTNLLKIGEDKSNEVSGIKLSCYRLKFAYLISIETMELECIPSQMMLTRNNTSKPNSKQITATFYSPYSISQILRLSGQ